MSWICFLEQDFFQLLRPGLQLLRPIKKEDVVHGREQRAGMVAYTEERCADFMQRVAILIMVRY